MKSYDQNTGVRGKDALFGDKFIQRTKSLLND
jgi:hypothetical protein